MNPRARVRMVLRFTVAPSLTLISIQCVLQEDDWLMEWYALSIALFGFSAIRAQLHVDMTAPAVADERELIPYAQSHKSSMAVRNYTALHFGVVIESSLPQPVGCLAV